MGYSNYKKLKQVTKTFGLSATQVQLFAESAIQRVEPSAWLKETLKIAKNFPLINEKVKVERIVSPILVEVANAYQEKVTLFSGEDLLVDSSRDLSGECDFFFTLVSRSLYLESPIISLVESKNEDMEYGRAQCAAQLYRRFWACGTISWIFIRKKNRKKCKYYPQASKVF